ncbi:hypothetical protein OQA88_11603 [Cercophora sp. LCS_1]
MPVADSITVATIHVADTNDDESITTPDPKRPSKNPARRAAEKAPSRGATPTSRPRTQPRTASGVGAVASPAAITPAQTGRRQRGRPPRDPNNFRPVNVTDLTSPDRGVKPVAKKPTPAPRTAPSRVPSVAPSAAPSVAPSAASGLSPDGVTKWLVGGKRARENDEADKPAARKRRAQVPDQGIQTPEPSPAGDDTWGPDEKKAFSAEIARLKQEAIDRERSFQDELAKRTRAKDDDMTKLQAKMASLATQHQQQMQKVQRERNFEIDRVKEKSAKVKELEQTLVEERKQAARGAKQQDADPKELTGESQHFEEEPREYYKANLKLQVEVAELENKLSEARRALQDGENSCNISASTRDCHLRQSSDEARKESEQLIKEKAQLEHANQVLRDSKKKLEQNLQVNEQEIKDLTDEANKAVHRAKEADANASQLKLDVKDLTEKLAETNAEVKSLKAAAAKSASEKATLEERVKTLEAEFADLTLHKDRLQHDLTTARQQKADLETRLAVDLDKAKAKGDSHLSQLLVARQTVESSCKEIETLKQQRDGLQESLSAAQLEKEEAENQLSTALAKAASGHESRQADIDAARQSAEHQQKEVAALKEMGARLQESLARVQDEAASRVSEIDCFKQTQKELELSLVASRNDAKVNRELAAARAGGMDELNTRLAHVGRLYAEADAEKRKHLQEANDLRAELARVKEQGTGVAGEAVQELTAAYAEKSARLQELSNKLIHAQQQKDFVERQSKHQSQLDGEHLNRLKDEMDQVKTDYDLALKDRNRLLTRIRELEAEAADLKQELKQRPPPKKRGRPPKSDGNMTTEPQEDPALQAKLDDLQTRYDELLAHSNEGWEKYEELDDKWEEAKAKLQPIFERRVAHHHPNGPQPGLGGSRGLGASLTASPVSGGLVNPFVFSGMPPPASPNRAWRSVSTVSGLRHPGDFANSPIVPLTSLGVRPAPQSPPHAPPSPSPPTPTTVIRRLLQRELGMPDAEAQQRAQQNVSAVGANATLNAVLATTPKTTVKGLPAPAGRKRSATGPVPGQQTEVRGARGSSAPATRLEGASGLGIQPEPTEEIVVHAASTGSSV